MMLSFKSYLNQSNLIREEYIKEQYDVLLEKLITLGGKAFPRYNNVVIMAGGAGSGKGFIKDNLLGVEGIVFDVDELKKMAAATPMIRKKVKDELGVDIRDLSNNLRDPDNVSRLHSIIADYLELDSKREKSVFNSIMTADPKELPNIIFDVTLKDLRKLDKITRQVIEVGYKKINIHIVWVVNDIEVAKAQNLERDRRVPAEILINTHRGASNTMFDIINMGKMLDDYMDGDIVFAFNKVGVDTELVTSKFGGKYVKDANYFYVKRRGKPVMSVDQLSKDLRAKIASYVPPGVDWA